jgi:hypothetical protein
MPWRTATLVGANQNSEHVGSAQPEDHHHGSVKMLPATRENTVGDEDKEGVCPLCQRVIGARHDSE